MTEERLKEIYEEWTSNWQRCTQDTPINEIKCKQLAADAYALEILEAIPFILAKLQED